jgi:hypothetical protein
MAILAYIRKNDPSGEGVYNTADCARVLGVSRSTVTRAWSRGWMERKPVLPAIKQVLAQELMTVRSERTKAHMAAIEEERAEVHHQAISDAARARKQEALMVQATRTVAGRMLSQAVRMTAGIETLTTELAAQIVDEYTGTDESGQRKKTITQKLRVVRDVQQIAKDSAHLAEQAMVLERKFLGEPEKILGIDTMGVDEAVAELYAGAKAIRRATTTMVNVTPVDDPIAGIIAQIDDPAAVLAKLGLPVPDTTE